MFRTVFFLPLAGLVLLLPTSVIAGGPPWLSLPVDGVTSESAQACGDLLTTKLANQLSPHAAPRVELRQQGKQWYLTCYLAKDIALGEIEAALAGSGFSVPRDKLRLFGHVVLEIDAGKKQPKKLLADLKALDHVSVVSSDGKDGRLLVTVDMPYPVEDGAPRNKTVGWDKFQRNDLSSDPATKSEAPTDARSLPSYAAFHDVVAKHQAKLTDLRWSTNYACRAVGCVVAPDAKVAVSAK